MIPQLCGLRHQKETRQKTTESQFLNAGVLPSIGGLGQPRISHRSFLRRRNGLTTQHSKHKLELPRASHKRGLRSRDAVNKRKTKRTENRRENRISYRIYKKAVLQTRFGKAKPAGFHNLAQDTPQPCLDARNFFLTAAHSRLDGFHKYRNKEKTLSNPKKPDDPNYQQDSAARWTMNSYIKFGSLNCRGLASEHSVTKKEVLVHSMRKLGLDMLFLQETHINTNSTETIEGFCFIYSTSITDAQRKQADKTRAENTARV